MEIGCGARMREFDGRRYVYFWHYEREGGRSVRREDYVGRIESPKTREDLLRRLAGYHRKAEDALERKRAAIERWLAREHTSA